MDRWTVGLTDTWYLDWEGEDVWTSRGLAGWKQVHLFLKKLLFFYALPVNVPPFIINNFIDFLSSFSLEKGFHAKCAFLALYNAVILFLHHPVATSWGCLNSCSHKLHLFPQSSTLEIKLPLRSPLPGSFRLVAAIRKHLLEFRICRAH